MSGEYHERHEDLPQEAIEYHRIIKSVIEEMEAVDWYNQRAVATEDEDVRKIVSHNRDEEIEHACMGLEWLRRNNEVWDEYLREFLFRDGDITEHGDEDEDEEDDDADNGSSSDGSLGIGSLKEGK
ncbi:MAG: encapsulin-associated ferritin-like protein [Halarsenatibacteraceae bacterium]